MHIKNPRTLQGNSFLFVLYSQQVSVTSFFQFLATWMFADLSHNGSITLTLKRAERNSFSLQIYDDWGLLTKGKCILSLFSPSDRVHVATIRLDVLDLIVAYGPKALINCFVAGRSWQSLVLDNLLYTFHSFFHIHNMYVDPGQYSQNVKTRPSILEGSVFFKSCFV